MSDNLFPTSAAPTTSPASSSAKAGEVAESDQPLIEELATRLRNGQLMFILGSGASFESGLPMGGALAMQLIRGVVGSGPTDDRVKELASKFPLDAVGSAFREAKDETRLREAIAGTYGAGNYKPTAVHKDLAYFADRRYIDRVYTTNFDTLIEDAIGDRRAEPITDENYEKLSRPRKDAPFPVLHLHGLADAPLIAEDDTYRLETPLGRILSADLISRWFVFIGYSMNDVDLRSLHFATNALLGATRAKVKKQWAVHPSQRPDEHLLAFNVWKGRSIEYINASADNFTTALRQRVASERDIDIARAFLRQTGRDPDDPDQVADLMEKAREVQRTSGLASLSDGLEMLARFQGVHDVTDL